MIEAPTREHVRRIAFPAMRSFPALFVDYCTRYEALAAFYNGDFRDPAARRTAADRAEAYDRDRSRLADVLLDQNARWGLDEPTRAHIEALRGSETIAVVTGQQAGLFTGPLYTLYKTLTVLQLARRLAEETGRPTVPVFWLAGEDHDFDEVATVHLERRNELVSLTYAGYTLPEHGNLGPVGRLPLGPAIEPLLDEVEDILPPTDFHAEVMAMLRRAYHPGATLLDAFARLMRSFFAGSGLVFINPDDARLKRLAMPLFRRELEDHATSAARVAEASDRLAAAGYHVQVHHQPTNLFLLEPDGRYALDAEGEDRFRLRRTDRLFTRAALLERLEAHPEHFSPNVILRPLMQDHLLPTAAYVAGPGEVSYFAQYRGVYDWAGIPMPIIYPRASVTLVESKVQKVLDRYERTVPDFREEVDKLFRTLVLEGLDVDLDAVFNEKSRYLHQAINELKPVIEGVDRTLVRAAEATRAALLKELAHLEERVVKAARRQQDTVRSQLAKARVNLFPDGSLQERVLSPIYYLNKYSPSLIDDLRDTLSLDTTMHQVVEL
ncbi:bacillithiol biosynthesis cysteine-adding enzyme BshC [Rhodothermaceae bacterium RA]|nr:bacillithiol biosynthesis cysteine-adding enzyme BshC [Rhodothermaceae bacterium RA]